MKATLNPGVRGDDSPVGVRMYAGEEPGRLWAHGYRQISRAHGIVARVDVTDEEMLAYFLKESPWGGGVPALPIEQQREHYRRCVSRDRIEGCPDRVMGRLR
jgi:hypothetical protein